MTMCTRPSVVGTWLMAAGWLVLFMDLTEPDLGYLSRSPAAPDFAISRTTCITVRQASVKFPWRDMASTMWRVTTGSTNLDDCRRQTFDAALIAYGPNKA